SSWPALPCRSGPGLCYGRVGGASSLEPTEPPARLRLGVFAGRRLLLLFLLQHPAKHLPHQGLRKRVPELHELRHLVPGEPELLVAAEAADLLRRGPFALLQHN